MIPAFVVSAYGEIFGSAWLLRPPSEREQELAAQVLIAAENGGGSSLLTEAVHLERKPMTRAVRALSKLGLIERRKNGTALTDKGRELMRQAHALRG